MAKRVAITGGPKTGKTTLAKRMGRAYSTDDLIDLGWSEASEAASRWFDAKGPLLAEGVAVPRALRKWLERNPKGKPIDRLIVLREPKRTLTKGQLTMGKGLQTVLKEIRPELERRGVIIEERK